MKLIGSLLSAAFDKEEFKAEELEQIKTIIPEYKQIPLQVPFLTDNGEYERNLVLVQRI